MTDTAEQRSVETLLQFVRVIELTKQGLDVRIAEVKKKLARIERR